MTAQDTLILCSRKDANKEFKIPLGEFNIKLKTSKHKKLNVLITKVQDSAFFVRVKSSSDKSRKELKEFYATLDSTKYPSTFTEAQYDSVLKRTKLRTNEISYPDSVRISFSEVRKIKVNNHFVPKKRKLMKAMGISGFVLVPSLFIAPLSQSVYVVAPVYALTGVWAITAVALQSTRLNMKKKWRVKFVK